MASEAQNRHRQIMAAINIYLPCACLSVWLSNSQSPQSIQLRCNCDDYRLFQWHAFCTSAKFVSTRRHTLSVCAAIIFLMDFFSYIEPFSWLQLDCLLYGSPTSRGQLNKTLRTVWVSENVSKPLSCMSISGIHNYTQRHTYTPLNKRQQWGEATHLYYPPP